MEKAEKQTEHHTIAQFNERFGQGQTTRQGIGVEPEQISPILKNVEQTAKEN